MPFSKEYLVLARRLHLRMERRVQPLRWTPAADVYESRDGWLIKMELAGVRPEDVRMQVRGKVLVVFGRRVDECALNGLRIQSMEITYTEFERGFEFPVNIEQAHIRTEFRNGMLLVQLVLEA